MHTTMKNNLVFLMNHLPQFEGHFVISRSKETIKYSIYLLSKIIYLVNKKATGLDSSFFCSQGTGELEL